MPGQTLHTSTATRWLLFCTPFLLVAGLAAFKWADWELYWIVAAREDGLVEYLTAFIYFAAAVMALVVTVRFYRRGEGLSMLLYAGLCGGFFFIGFEEISWGQRIFDIASPDFFAKRNAQGEMNVHNFAGRYPLHMAYILVGAYGTVAFVLVPKVLARISEGRYAHLAPLIAPPWFLAPFFLPTFLLYTYYDYVSPILVRLFGRQVGWEWGRGQELFMIAKDQEPIECVLALGFLAFIVHIYRKQAAGRLLPERRADQAFAGASRSA